MLTKQALVRPSFGVSKVCHSCRTGARLAKVAVLSFQCSGCRRQCCIHTCTDRTEVGSRREAKCWQCKRGVTIR